MSISTILVRVLGDSSNLTRTLARAQSSLGGLDRTAGSITSTMRLATIATLIFSAAAVGAGALGAAALAAIPLALVGIGVAFAATNERVKSAFSGLKDHVVTTMKDIAAPLVGPLVRGAGQIQKAFDLIAPALARIFKAAAPLLDDFFAALIPLARQLGPMLENAFKVGEPVLRAFGRGLVTVVGGLDAMLRELGKGTPQFTAFVDAFFRALATLLPALGRLMVALAPIGTVILQTLIPALVELSDWLAVRVGPAFEAVTGFLERHSTIAKATGVALIGLVLAIKAVQLAMAIATTATLLFSGVASVVRGAIILWKNAQFALNIVMLTNPMFLLIAAIVAVIAIIVIIGLKTGILQKIMSAAWGAIKKHTVAVWGAIKSFLSGAFDFLKKLFFNFTGPGLIIKHWDTIKSATTKAWNFIKGLVQRAISAVLNVIRTHFNQIKNAVSAAWNAVRDATSRIWSGIKNAVSTAVGAVMGVVRSIRGKVVGAFAGAGSWLVNAGRDLIRGLIGGVKAMAGAIVGAAKDVVGGAIDAAKSLLGIGSPSRLFRQYGIWVGEGLNLGLKAKAGAVAASATGLAGAVARGFAAPQLTLNAGPGFTPDAAAGTTVSAGSTKLDVTLNVPVGASAADIGREFVRFIEAYLRAGGRFPGTG